MRAAVRSVYSVDVHVPEDPESDRVWIRLVVGPADGPCEESFDVLVCTPLWLRDVVAKEGPQIGRHHSIVDPFGLAAAKPRFPSRVDAMLCP